MSGTLNLYASTAHAFDGHHQELAAALGAWAAGATTNADLSFSTLDTARRAPRVLADQAIIETAAGFVMAAAKLSDDEAKQRIYDAARRAGVSEVQVAESVVAAGRQQESWPPGTRRTRLDQTGQRRVRTWSGANPWLRPQATAWERRVTPIFR